jgi:glycosyltransferase involved in cell wall biosynthesis
LNSPFFSVVIPTFNRASTILDTLQSISDQRFRDFEVVVVDDGSDDATCEIVQTSGVASLIQQANCGPGAARNKGVQSAVGQYIAFLDSDDVWFPWTLSTYAEIIRRHNSPAFITGKPQLFEDLAEVADCKETQIKAESFADYYASGDEWRWFGVSSFVIRRDVFIQAGGFADGRINGEDADLAMRLGAASGFVHVTSPRQFGYRVHTGNVTNDASKSQAGLELLLSSEATGRYPGGRERSYERARIIARHVRPFAVSAAKSGQAVTAIRFYLAVIRESLANRRWRFLFGLPMLAVWGLVLRCFSARTRS